MKTIDEVLKLQEKFDEEIKVKDALYTLREYCNKHDDCEGCFIRSKFVYGVCPCASLLNFCEV